MKQIWQSGNPSPLLSSTSSLPSFPHSLSVSKNDSLLSNTQGDLDLIGSSAVALCACQFACSRKQHMLPPYRRLGALFDAFCTSCAFILPFFQ